MLAKLLKRPEKDALEIEEKFDQIIQISNASPEQLNLYRTQSLLKIDGILRIISKNLRILKNCMIAILVILIIIALLL